MKFEKYAGGPVFGSGEIGTVFDAYVTKEGAHLRMDFSWRKEKALAVTFSADGIHWSAPRKTFTFDPASGWEDDVNRNCVLKIKATYRMWYTGQARGHSFIGLAESADGLHFHRVGDEPILIPEYPYEGASVMNPCVLYENGHYRMWYSAGETYEPNVLCLAESDDGVNWQKARCNPIFVCDPHNPYEADRVGGCQVLPHPTLGYLLFYIGYRDVDTACICVAASENGKTGFRRFVGNPIVSPEAGSWDADACYKPTAVYDAAAGRWRVWYNGRTGPDEYIGLAEAAGDFCLEDFC